MSYIKSKIWTRPFVATWLIALNTLFFIISPSTLSLAGEEHFENTPLIGVVKKVSLQKGFLVLKSPDGKRQQVVFDEQTALKGVLLVEEIKPKQRIKVWYVLEDDLVKALKIEVMPELGC